MSKQRRSFKLEEKLRIIREADELGVTKVLDKYHLAYSVLFRWKSKLEVLKNLTLDQVNNPSQEELKLLLEENIRLKKIIAEQALQIEIDREYMKTNQAYKNKN
jgi:putative transposase